MKQNRKARSAARAVLRGVLAWSLSIVVIAAGVIGLSPALLQSVAPAAVAAGSGRWQWWMSAPSPANSSTVNPGTTITYTLNARRQSGNNPVTGATATLTLTGNATFTSTGSVGTSDGTATIDSTGKSLTWTGMNLSGTTTRTITVTATVSGAASGGTIVATMADNGDANGTQQTGTGYYGTTTHTIATPVTNSCNFATPGSGAYSRQICWFDLTGYDATQAATTAGQVMRQTLPGNYTLSYTIAATGNTNLKASGLPTYPQAFLGNGGPGYSNNYQGIGGTPALYQQNQGSTSTLTLTNISLTDASGNPVRGFALVGADAESTDGGESLTWTSDQPLTSIGALGNACGGGFSGTSGTSTTMKCTGGGNGAGQDKNGAAILYSVDPTTFSQTMVGSGLQAVAFGVMVSGIQLQKQIVNPVSTADAYTISVNQGSTLVGSATTNAAGTADTGQLYRYDIATGTTQTFTMSETPANTSTKQANYAPTWACTRNGTPMDTSSGSTELTGSANATSRNVTLSVGDFVVCKITNTGPTLTLTKSVDNTASGASGLTPAAWSLSAAPSGGGAAVVNEAPTQSSSTSGNVTTASTATHAVAAGSYVLGESSSNPNGAGYAQGAWSCVVTGTSTAVPVTVNGDVSSVNITVGQAVTCAVTNTAKTGTATWQKVAADASKTLLSGSQWTLAGPGIAPEGVTVTDCTASSCTATSASAPTDQDSAKGRFELINLAWGDYTLVEKTAPVGYALDTTAHTFTISATSLSPTDTGSPFSNAQQAVPKLPLTGGASADAYLMAGAVLLMLSCALGIIGVRRRKGDAKRH